MVVRIVHLEKDDTINYPPEVEVYELSVGKWRRISAGDFHYGVNPCTPQAFLDGVVHWVGYDRNKGRRILVVSFNFKNEGLTVIKARGFAKQEMEWEIRVGMYRDRLSLIHTPTSEASCNVWVMEEYAVADSWKKLFTINLNPIKFLLMKPMSPSYFRENGEILLAESNSYLLGSSADLLCYDPKSKQTKKVEGKKCVSYVGSYMETLVLIALKD